MNIQKRFLSLMLFVAMLISNALISVPVLAQDYTLYTSTIICMDNNDTASVGETFVDGNTSDSTILLDRRNAAAPDKSQSRYREAYLQFDFSDQIDDLLAGGFEAVQMSLTPNGNGLNAGTQWALYLLTPEMANGLNKANLPNHKACRDKGYIGYTDNLVWTSPTNMTDKTTVTSSDDAIKDALVNYFEENPGETVAGFRLALTAGSTLGIMGPKHGTMDWRPHMTLSETEDASRISEAAGQLKGELPRYASGDVTLPAGLPEFPGVSITWESLDKNIIRDDGTIAAFPSDTTVVQMAATFEAGGFSRVVVYEISVLKSGSYLAEVVRESESKIGISFEISQVPPGTAGYILKIPASYFAEGKEYILSASGGELARFFPNLQDDYCMVSVSQNVGAAAAAFQLESTDGVINVSEDLCILDAVNSSVREVMDAIDSVDLGDLSAVTANLSLPASVNGVEITWESSDPAHLGVNGRVDRPRSSEADARVALTASAEADGYGYTRNFAVTILKQSGESSGYPELSDPNHISDEEFFGKWDGQQAKWTTAPILRYDRFPELDAVLAYVKQNDYLKAKDELLTYYRNRTSVPAYKLPTDDSYLNAEMMAEMIYGWMQVDNVAGVGAVKPEWQEYSIDLSVGMLPATLFLIESEMDGSAIEIGSKETPGDTEGQYGAKLEAFVDGVKRTFPVVADTYISADENKDTNYGGAEMLYSREAAGESLSGNPPVAMPNPFSGETRRPYFRFDVSNVSGKIESVKLKFYAKTDSGADKKVFAFTSGNEKRLDENTFTWAGHVPYIFNFKQTGYVWDSTITNRWNLEGEWQNYGARMYPIGWLIGRYKNSGNELYAYRALEFMTALYTQQESPTFPRDLEGGWRTEYLCILFFGTLYSNSITPELLVSQLKYAYVHAHAMAGAANNTAFNQVSAKLSGAIRTMTYFPELEVEGDWAKAKNTFEALYAEQLNADGSYSEATTGYMSGVVKELRSTIEWVLIRDGKDDRQYQAYLDYYRKLVKYMFDFSMPYGLTIPWGDGGRQDNQTFAYNEYLLHPEVDPKRHFEYVHTQGMEGNEPDYTSIAYRDKAIAFLKSGWMKDDFGAVINANYGGTHSHPADLSLDVSAFGSVLLTEAGGGSYTAGSPLAGISNKTYSHNTIEIDKKSQKSYDYGSNKKNQPQKMLLATNKLFDFVEAGSNDKIYPGFDVNRKVLFLHNSCWIVSDYITPKDNEPHIYKQGWRPDQRSNLTIDPDTKAMTTHYQNGPNIQVVPADPETLDARVESSYTTNPTYGEALSDYVRYCREGVTGPQTFDTLLYPGRQGEQKHAAVTRIDMGGVPTIDATALKVDMGLNTGYYYSSNEEDPPPRAFDQFSTDGQMAYVELDQYDGHAIAALTKGQTIKQGDTELVKTEERVDDLGVQWNLSVLNLFTENGALPTTKIYSDTRITKVTLNGVSIDFDYAGKYVTIGETSKVEPPPASKPGGSVGSSKGNGNSSNPLVAAPPTAPATPSPAPSATPSPAEEAFEDIAGHWAENEIVSMYEKGVVSAPDDRLFRPEDAVTRAEFAAYLARALKLGGDDAYEGMFHDVGEGDWYAAAVEGAGRAGILSGYDDGTFRPNEPVTREEMAKLLLAACDYLNLPYDETLSADDYIDRPDISDWAVAAVSAVTGLGLMKGEGGGRFAPRDGSTRAQAVVVISRLLSKAGR